MSDPTRPVSPPEPLTAELARVGVAAAWAALQNDVLHPGDFASQLPQLFEVGRRGVENAYATLDAARAQDETGLRAAAAGLIRALRDDDDRPEDDRTVDEWMGATEAALAATPAPDSDLGPSVERGRVHTNDVKRRSAIPALDTGAGRVTSTDQLAAEQRGLPIPFSAPDTGAEEREAAKMEQYLVAIEAEQEADSGAEERLRAALDEMDRRGGFETGVIAATYRYCAELVRRALSDGSVDEAPQGGSERSGE
jgi:hypothetical protein